MTIFCAFGVPEKTNALIGLAHGCLGVSKASLPVVEDGDLVIRILLHHFFLQDGVLLLFVEELQ